VLNNKLKNHSHHESSAPSDETIVSLFSDSNPPVLGAIPNAWSILTGRKIDTSIGTTAYIPPLIQGGILEPLARFEDRPVAAFPLWSFTFDYHKPDLRSETEFIGVHGIRSLKQDLARGSERSVDVTWPAGFHWKVKKLPRQGMYDNVHVHGSMGDDPIAANTTYAGPMVHAPGCAEACIHLHWRWGTLSKIPIPGSNFDKSAVEGWAAVNANETDKTLYYIKDRIGLPLVPPNQDIAIAITHPDCDRIDPWSAVVTTSRALDPKRKVLWYTTDVSDPKASDWQIMLPMALSFAFAYHPSLISWANENFLETTLKGTPLEPHTTIVDKDERKAVLLHDLYSLSRWFTRFTSTTTALIGPQLPPGDYNTSGGKTLEEL
jgi:hypothetical protein